MWFSSDDKPDQLEVKLDKSWFVLVRGKQALYFPYRMWKKKESWNKELFLLETYLLALVYIISVMNSGPLNTVREPGPSCITL